MVAIVFFHCIFSEHFRSGTSLGAFWFVFPLFFFLLFYSTARAHPTGLYIGRTFWRFGPGKFWDFVSVTAVLHIQGHMFEFPGFPASIAWFVLVRGSFPPQETRHTRAQSSQCKLFGCFSLFSVFQPFPFDLSQNFRIPSNHRREIKGEKEK